MPPSRRFGLIRAPQGLVAGLTLAALAALALWLTKDLSQGTLRALGPAMLPRWLAMSVGLCGAALVIASLVKDGDPLERWSLRGPFFVIVGIVAFGLTIRQFGLVVAGPLAMLIGGFATPEARPRELIIFTIVMTAFCVGLFRYTLNLPIPILILPGLHI